MTQVPFALKIGRKSICPGLGLCLGQRKENGNSLNQLFSFFTNRQGNGIILLQDTCLVKLGWDKTRPWVYSLAVEE